jgi:hypothetical protein
MFQPDKPIILPRPKRKTSPMLAPYINRFREEHLGNCMVAKTLTSSIVILQFESRKKEILHATVQMRDQNKQSKKVKGQIKPIVREKIQVKYTCKKLIIDTINVRTIGPIKEEKDKLLMNSRSFIIMNYTFLQLL